MSPSHARVSNFNWIFAYSKIHIYASTILGAQKRFEAEKCQTDQPAIQEKSDIFLSDWRHHLEVGELRKEDRAQ